MDLLQRERQRDHQAGGLPDGDPVGQGLQELREVGEQMFRESDEAIRRALSGDALATLEQTRQSGGQ